MRKQRTKRKKKKKERRRKNWRVWTHHWFWGKRSELNCELNVAGGNGKRRWLGMGITIYEGKTIYD